MFHQVVCTDPYGDHLLVGHLLELNGLDLDQHHSEFGGIPLRRAGLVLVVNIAYHNTVPFSFLRRRGRRWGGATKLATVFSLS